jgi:uncharacterized protein involved in type VI secretion and phage assembly
VAEISGVMVGVIVDTKDPERRGRVRVRLPALDQSHWARVATASDSARGSTVRLAEHDEVLVAFAHGDVRQPFVLGGLWSGAASPPASTE